MSSDGSGDEMTAEEDAVRAYQKAKGSLYRRSGEGHTATHWQFCARADVEFTFFVKRHGDRAEKKDAPTPFWYHIPYHTRCHGVDRAGGHNARGAAL